jgi:hypothetical protein
VKRLVALAVGAFGVRALLRRRAHGVEPADELRARLAANRPAEAPEPGPQPEATAPDEPLDGVPEDPVDARRADVHARARQAIDELSS